MRGILEWKVEVLNLATDMQIPRPKIAACIYAVLGQGHLKLELYHEAIAFAQIHFPIRKFSTRRARRQAVDEAGCWLLYMCQTNLAATYVDLAASSATVQRAVEKRHWSRLMQAW